jgi:hypothetical protein
MFHYFAERYHRAPPARKPGPRGVGAAAAANVSCVATAHTLVTIPCPTCQDCIEQNKNSTPGRTCLRIRKNRCSRCETPDLRGAEHAMPCCRRTIWEGDDVESA